MAEGPVEEQAPAPDEGWLLDVGQEDEAAKRTVYLLTLSRLLPETLQAAEGALRSLEELKSRSWQKPSKTFSKSD